MTGKIGRKKVLKFRDFPTCLRGEVFFVENGYDEKLNLSRECKLNCVKLQ